MRLYNVTPYPVIVGARSPAVFPGMGRDFTDQELEGGVPEGWSEQDPRAGIAQERAFKARRKQEAARLAEGTNRIEEQ